MLGGWAFDCSWKGSEGVSMKGLVLVTDLVLRTAGRVFICLSETHFFGLWAFRSGWTFRRKIGHAKQCSLAKEIIHAYVHDDPLQDPSQDSRVHFLAAEVRIMERCLGHLRKENCPCAGSRWVHARAQVGLGGTLPDGIGACAICSYRSSTGGIKHESF